MTKIFFVTDVEATGPCPYNGEVYEFASVPVLSDGTVLEGRKFILAVSGEKFHKITMKFLQEELEITFETLHARTEQEEQSIAMHSFVRFVKKTLIGYMADEAILIPDNLAFDSGFVNYYLWKFVGETPFGHSGWNLPCLSLGFYGNREKWEEFRTEEHNHDSLCDTRGNAGALAHMIKDGLIMD